MPISMTLRRVADWVWLRNRFQHALRAAAEQVLLSLRLRCPSATLTHACALCKCKGHHADAFWPESSDRYPSPHQGLPRYCPSGIVGYPFAYQGIPTVLRCLAPDLTY